MVGACFQDFEFENMTNKNIVQSGALRRALQSTESSKRKTCVWYTTSSELPAGLPQHGVPPPFVVTCVLRLSYPMSQWPGVVAVLLAVTQLQVALLA